MLSPQQRGQLNYTHSFPERRRPGTHTTEAVCSGSGKDQELWRTDSARPPPASPSSEPARAVYRCPRRPSLWALL